MSSLSPGYFLNGAMIPPPVTFLNGLTGRLHFDLPPDLERPRSFKSTEAAFQKFRWIHVPTQVGGGEFRYRVTAKYMDANGQVSSGAQVENAISLDPKIIDGFANVGFTRLRVVAGLRGPGQQRGRNPPAH